MIVQNRKRYVELAVKKNLKSSEGNGYHAGLSDEESSELLALENLLPMEALEAFHLLALRTAYVTQQATEAPLDGNSSTAGNEDTTPTHQSKLKVRAKGSNPFRRLTSGKLRSSIQPYSGLGSEQHSRHRQTLLHQGDSSFSADDISSSKNSVSLLEAMTLRLGKKSWYIYWKLHDATVNLVFLGPQRDKQLAHVVLRASGRARSFGKGKRDFFFDLTQCHVFHRDDRALYFRALEDGSIFEDDDHDEVLESVGDTDDMTVFVPSGEACPDLVTASTFLTLPPRGAVCRLAAGKNDGSFKLSISAHPATLVWTTALYDSMSEFFNLQSSDAREDLSHLIRNAATPLARKAQLALLSPASMSLHVNISAPKIWVPISSSNSEGSALVDAGTLKVSSVKDEGETDMNWDIQVRDIRMNFVQGRNLEHSLDKLQFQLMSQLGDITGRAETSVIRPFHVGVVARNTVLHDSDGAILCEGEGMVAGPVRSVDVVVSPVCLNLVDAETLARAFGKWYSRGISGVQRRVSSRSEPTGNHDTSVEPEPVVFAPVIESTIPRLVSVTIDKVEIALQGHSKTASAILDDRSLASHESLHEVAPPTRTYLVEIEEISIRQSRRDELSTTQFSILDASILRLRDGSFYAPLKNSRDAIESQYCILVRADDKFRRNKPILRASLMHDRIAHLDEVEIDIDSVILRVTPTTLKDCAKAFRRVAELAQLMTREMERKVHEEGRKARRRDRISKLKPPASCFRFSKD